MFEPDYAYYTSQGGKAGVEEFTSSLPHALARVEYVIWPNKVTEDSANAFKNAVCAMVDEVITPTYSADRGFSIGSFSMNNDHTDKERAELDARHIWQYLRDTDLLYMGLD